MTRAGVDSPRPRAFDIALIALALVAAVGWSWASAHDSAEGGWLLAKATVLPALALVAARRRGSILGAGALAVALLCHALGDLLLEVAPFLTGVAAFFLGHLLYIRLFWRHRLTLDEIGGGAKLLLGLLGLFGAVALSVLAPRLSGPLAVAVPLYAAALLAMTGCAQIVRGGRPWVPLGALAFLVSDLLLSLALFRAAGGAAGVIEASRLLVWPLYVAGQAAIALGWLYSPAAINESRADLPD